MPRELLARLGDSLDYLVVREAPCAPEGGTVVAMGPRGRVAGVATLQRVGDRTWYGWEGAELLDLAVVAPWESPSETALAASTELRTRCLSADRARPETWCVEAEWREVSRYSTRPDAVNQLVHLYDTDRAGTVNLFPRAGVGYNTVVPGRHAGESFAEKDAFVGLWGVPVADAGALPPTVNGSVPQAIYGWVTGERPVPGQDGWGWPAWPEGLVRE